MLRRFQRGGAQSLALAIVLIVIVFGLNQAVIAQLSQPEPTREQLILQIGILRDQIAKMEAGQCDDANNPILLKACEEYRKKHYEYLADQMAVNIRAYRTQEIASNIILFLVVLVVVAGTAFAGFQLWKSVSIAGLQANSELELSASKVRVTSSVVGVVVLTISLVFLYIYTTEIYHIRVVGQPATATTATSSK